MPTALHQGRLVVLGGGGWGGQRWVLASDNQELVGELVEGGGMRMCLQGMT